MMTLAVNYQKMKYSIKGERQPIYELDEDGNKVIEYVDDEGNVYYKETGRYTSGWSVPEEFMANISLSGGEAEAQTFGLSPADYDAVIVSSKDQFPFKEGDIIWHTSELKFQDDGDVESKSADYTVFKVADSLNFTRFVLKAIVK